MFNFIFRLLGMHRVGFEPTRIAPYELESYSLTARTSVLIIRIHWYCTLIVIAVWILGKGATRIRTEVLGFKVPCLNRLDDSAVGNNHSLQYPRAHALSIIIFKFTLLCNHKQILGVLRIELLVIRLFLRGIPNLTHNISLVVNLGRRHTRILLEDF